MTRQPILPALALVSALAVAACGGGAGAATPTQAAGAAQPTQAAAGGGGNRGTGGSSGGGGGGAIRGFDCATVLTPAELDQISGFKGGTVTTTSRGDQNPSTPGYGECSFEEPKAQTWFGTLAISSGPALEGFQIQFDFNKDNGGTLIQNLGSEALLVESEAGTTLFAKSADGVGVQASIAFVTNETSKEKGKAELQKIVETVLGRV